METACISKPSTSCQFLCGRICSFVNGKGHDGNHRCKAFHVTTVFCVPWAVRLHGCKASIGDRAILHYLPTVGCTRKMTETSLQIAKLHYRDAMLSIPSLCGGILPKSPLQGAPRVCISLDRRLQFRVTFNSSMVAAILMSSV